MVDVAEQAVFELFVATVGMVDPKDKAFIGSFNEVMKNLKTRRNR